MEEEIKNSEFFHFGLLPSVCIHTLVQDQYSHMYIPEEICTCGCNEWVEGKMALFEKDGLPYMFKDVHRCKNCNKVRIANHVGKEE